MLSGFDQVFSEGRRQFWLEIAQVTGAKRAVQLGRFRMLAGSPKVKPGFPQEKFLSRNHQGLEKILLSQAGRTLAIPVGHRLAAPKTVATSAVVMGALVGLNFWICLSFGLVFPLVVAMTVFALNMSWSMK